LHFDRIPRTTSGGRYAGVVLCCWPVFFFAEAGARSGCGRCDQLVLALHGPALDLHLPASPLRAMRPFRHLALYCLLSLPGSVALAQGCSMCKTSAEAAAAEQQKALNRGILVLALPSVIIF